MIKISPPIKKDARTKDFDSVVTGEAFIANGNLFIQCACEVVCISDPHYEYDTDTDGALVIPVDITDVKWTFKKGK
jgi:hypothetical protein